MIANFAFLLSTPECKGLVLLPHGEFHNEQRKMFSTVMRKMDNEVYDNFINTHIKSFNQVLEDSKGSPIDICPHISKLMFSCIGQLIFGIKTDVKDIEKLVEGNLSNNPFIVLSGKLIPECVKHKISKYVDMTTNFQKSFQKIKLLVKKERQNADFTKRFMDIVGGYIHSYEAIRTEHEDSGKLGSPFVSEDSTSTKQLAAILLDCYQAGMEATTAQASWMFLYLARNVHVQRKVQAEMDQVIGRGKQYLLLLMYSCISQKLKNKAILRL